MTQRDLLPAPKTADEALSIASQIAKSALIPKQFQGRPQDVFACMLWSHTLNMPIMQGLQSIAIINGRPSLWGDGLLAIVMSSGKLEDFKETIDRDSDGKLVATCTVKRKGLSSPVTWSFSEDDATTAGLWNKLDTWKKYPKRMLQMRARAFALRSAFPDVLSGMGSAEEETDIEESEADASTAEAAPARKMPARKAKKVEPDDVVDAEPVEPIDPVKPVETEPELEAPAEEAPAFDVDGLMAQIEATETVDELRRLYCHTPKDVRTSDVVEAFRARKDVLEGAA